MIIYGILGDYTYEYPCIGKDTSFMCVMNFAEKIMPVFGTKYTGHIGNPTNIVYVVAFKDSWFGHYYLGLLGSHNDINVMHVRCDAPCCNFYVNAHAYDMCYYIDRCYLSFWKNISEQSRISR